MAENKKRSVVDFGLNILRELIGTGEKAPQVQEAVKQLTVEDISLEDLNRDRIILENEERKRIAEMSEIESQKRRLFEAGVKNSSVHEQKVIARRMIELEGRVKNIDSMLKAISKEIRVVSGLIQILERTQLRSKMGLSGTWGKIKLTQVIAIINKEHIDWKLNDEKIDQILIELGYSDSDMSMGSEEPGVDKLLGIFQKAQEAGDVDKGFSEAVNLIKEINKETNKEEPEKDY